MNMKKSIGLGIVFLLLVTTVTISSQLVLADFGEWTQISIINYLGFFDNQADPIEDTPDQFFHVFKDGELQDLPAVYPETELFALRNTVRVDEEDVATVQEADDRTRVVETITFWEDEDQFVYEEELIMTDADPPCEHVDEAGFYNCQYWSHWDAAYSAYHRPMEKDDRATVEIWYEFLV